MWLLTRSASGEASGRVALDRIVAFTVVDAGSGTAFFVSAHAVNGSDYKVTDESATSRAAALAKINDVILNGS